MPKGLFSETQNLLDEHLKSLKKRLAELDGDRSILLQEIEQAERAFNSITTRKHNYKYNKDSTFRQKITFCLNSRNRILTVNDMVEMLTKLDTDLANDKLNTAKSLRVQIRRMLTEKEIKDFKPENMKNIHYGLKSWLDENGNLKSEYTV